MVQKMVDLVVVERVTLVEELVSLDREMMADHTLQHHTGLVVVVVVLVVLVVLVGLVVLVVR